MRGDNGNFDGENIGKLQSKNVFTVAPTAFESGEGSGTIPVMSI
jgi:hypothetical protein